MAAPKIELTTEGVKHALKVNGVSMNWVRKAVITVEANQLASIALEFGPEYFFEQRNTQEEITQEDIDKVVASTMERASRNT